MRNTASSSGTPVRSTSAMAVIWRGSASGGPIAPHHPTSPGGGSLAATAIVSAGADSPGPSARWHRDPMAADQVQELGFDPDALRARYEQERLKRLRDDGADQYIEMAGTFSHYAEDDPYADPTFDRDPLTDDIEIAIIGGGFSGLLAAARLAEQGVTDIRVIEAGADYGGTWYWNRYPGAQCDTESYCYLPLLEELGYMPKEKYSYVTEIFEHSQRIGQHYGLYEKTCFQTRVRSIDWDEERQRWHITTNRGDDMKARFVVMALGTTTRAKLPGLPGIESFE